MPEQKNNNNADGQPKDDPVRLSALVRLHLPINSITSPNENEMIKICASSVNNWLHEINRRVENPLNAT
jgi:hypothetical protein